MSNFPDWVYKFTPRDEQVTPLEIFINADNKTLASTYLEVPVFVVPLDRILILTSVTFQVLAGAGQSADYSHLYFTGSGGSVYTAIAKAWERRVAGVEIATIDCEVHIPGGTTIVAANFFDVGAVDNIAEHTVTGILIPRGNFAI